MKLRFIHGRKAHPLQRVGLMALLACGAAFGQSNVAETKHNLSASGPGTIKVGEPRESCVYCHTPHAANPIAPLWNRNDSGQFYQTYESSTLKATVGQPTGSSRLCLSCHDGTIALNQTYNPNNSAASTVHLQPGDRGYIGTDLRDDHPISFRYDSALAAQRRELRDPITLPPELPLDHDKQLQCTTCHDPHDDRFGQFLRMDNTESRMCTTCHQMTDWAQNPHALSNASLASATRDDWANLKAAATVRAAGCESCHRPHSGGGRPRLLRRDVEEDNCYSCHDGTVAQTNILAQATKASVHPFGLFQGVHDPMEESATMEMHVECADCHSPHRMAASGSSQAPQIKPTMRGASGVTSTGSAIAEALYEYQVCYKCHSGANPAGTPTVNRVVPAADIAELFAPNNASFHPVEATGKNADVPSLMSPRTTASMIYCTDCHGSSGTTSAKGPHGSDFAPLLVRNYSTIDDTPESPQAYDLCYSCHSRQSILGDQSFPEHRRHIVDSNTPCSVCHDAHGVSASAGGLSGTHLINFDRDVVKPAAGGEGPTFTDLGARRASCTLSCHGRDHQNVGY